MGIGIPPGIVDDLDKRLGIRVEDARPVSGGYLNEKWRARTNRGELLIKKFSGKRYPYRKLQGVRRALLWQNEVCARGIPCPEIITLQGEPIQRLFDGTAYAAMPFLLGEQTAPEAVTAAQMESLGEVCGRMHRAFSEIPVDGLSFQRESPLEKFRQDMRDIRGALVPGDISRYADAVGRAVDIAEGLTEAFFRWPAGITHKDFAIDNILFVGDRVSAVLDFDTANYNFPHRDIGRALLSFTLNGDGFMPDRVRALMRGYAKAMGALSPRQMADAVRLIGYSELPTWFRPDLRLETRDKVVRFRWESIWLVEHWHDLEILLQ